jgi:hypothetical protein
VEPPPFRGVILNFGIESVSPFDSIDHGCHGQF